MSATFRPDLLAGKVAVVTGGTSGLGAATAGYLARLGARVYALGLGAETPDFDSELQIEVRELDVTDDRQLTDFFAGLDRLDVLDSRCRDQPRRARARMGVVHPCRGDSTSCRLSHDRSRKESAGRGRRRVDRDDRLDVLVFRWRRDRRVFRVEGRCGPTDQVVGSGLRTRRHPGELHCARLDRHTAPLRI